jgi:hypothetical protein
MHQDRGISYIAERLSHAIRTMLFAVLLVLWPALRIAAQQQNSVSEFNVPDEVSKCMKLLGSGYAISGKINPFYLRGDFDGDGKPDYAVLVQSGNQHGIVICRGSAVKPVLLGAGTDFHQMKDLSFSAWQIHSKAHPVEEGVEAGRPPILRGDAILIEWEESASAIVYWNGKQFVWYQQGD